MLYVLLMKSLIRQYKHKEAHQIYKVRLIDTAIDMKTKASREMPFHLKLICFHVKYLSHVSKEMREYDNSHSLGGIHHFHTY